MPTYVVFIPDSKILEEVASFKSVVLVGCPHCPNSSIASEKNMPVHKISVDKTSGRSTWLPIAMIEEINRL